MRAVSFIAVIGALQGAVILLSILFRFRHRKNLPLALLLIVFSLRLATIPTWTEEILKSFPWVYPLTAPLPFLFGALLWWYIKEIACETLCRPGFLFIHFLPYFLEFLMLVFSIASMSGKEYEVFIHMVFTGNPPLWLPLRNGLKVLINIVYMILSARIAFGKKSMRLSSAKRLWIRCLVIVPSIVLACFAYVAIYPGATRQLSGGNVLPFFILSVTMLSFIYVISFLFLVSPDFSLLEYIQGNKVHEQLCSEVECRYIVEEVERKFKKEAFKNPDLTLLDFAAELKIHPNRLSYAINHCCGISFRTLLNRRRLEYFCKMVSSGCLEKRPILDIAFEAGFPSKSTFNRVFREKTGMSPSEYLKKTDIA